MIGSKLAHYEITAHVGSGGMGHVYRATDSKLGRNVAIKMLPEEFARDAERIARLEREARTLASLNHPCIAAIYGLEESDGRSFLVMEYVAGETLAERIRRGPLPIDEALAIALQIATALEAAHETGVMHRDLKPANIKVTRNGDVKLLDFGLAKAFAPDQRTDLSQSPTMSVMATRVGVILGTAAYMSPEQARGKEIDRRSDIFAFGCVLYEMLTGRQAFEGETAAEILARVIEREPDWSKLPVDVPPRVRELLQRCLEKDPRKRRRDSGDVRIDLEQALAASALNSGEAHPAAATHAPAAKTSWIAVVATAASAILIAAAAVGFILYRPTPETVRFEVTIPRASDSPSLALSPDGRLLAYAAGGSSDTTMLFVRPLSSAEARPLAGTEGARRPFFSPDGEHIGFVAQGQLKRVALAGGSPQRLADVGPVFFGGAWGADGVILFTAGAGTPIRRVSAAGGEIIDATTLDLSVGEESHGAPVFLPDGQRFLYGTATGRRPGVYMSSLSTSDSNRVLPAFARAEYGSKFLVFNREGELFAQAFDIDRRAFSGEAERVASGVAWNPPGVAAFSVSGTGVLAYRVASERAVEQSSLVWYGRDGNRLAAVDAPREYSGVALSPDGRQVAVHVHDAPAGVDIWVFDLERGRASTPTLGRFHHFMPRWSPHADRLMYARNTGAAMSIHQRQADGAGQEELVLDNAPLEWPTDWSADGTTALITHGTPANLDISALSMTGGSELTPLVNSEYREDFATFSPDGRWIAYVSDDSGRAEVYVKPSRGTGGPWPASTAGGDYPRWARNGNELFYLTSNGTLMTVAFDPDSATFNPDSQRALFTADFVLEGHDAFRDIPYDVSPDGERFLVNERVRPGSADSESAQSGRIVVVLNWTAELR